MSNHNLPYTTFQQALLSGVKFRKMDEEDFEIFAGADETCIIGETETHIIIVGTDAVHIIDAEGEETMFTLSEV